MFWRFFTNYYYQQILTNIRIFEIMLKCCLDNRSQNVHIFSEKRTFWSQNIKIILINIFRENEQNVNQRGSGYFALRSAGTPTKLGRFWTKMIQFSDSWWEKILFVFVFCLHIFRKSSLNFNVDFGEYEDL